MNNVGIWLIITLFGILFGLLHYKASYDSSIKAKNNYFKFLEFWREGVNYFIAGLVAYYFIDIRWPHLNHGATLSLSDFVIGAVFLMAIMGWLPYFVKNITEGITAIFARVFSK